MTRVVAEAQWRVRHFTAGASFLLPFFRNVAGCYVPLHYKGFPCSQASIPPTLCFLLRWQWGALEESSFALVCPWNLIEKCLSGFFKYRFSISNSYQDVPTKLKFLRREVNHMLPFPSAYFNQMVPGMEGNSASNLDSPCFQHHHSPVN